MGVSAAQNAAQPERYVGLRTASTILKRSAWVIAILGPIAVFATAINAGRSESPGSHDGLAVLIGGMISVALYALFAFAFAEMIRLALAVEANTRRAADAASIR